MAGRGRFITLEGGEGAGKSTQAVRLETALSTAGIRVLRTREPGGSPGADILRTLLLSGAHAWTPMAEVLLHFAARAEHLTRTIQPALDQGVWVLCDRFADSTMAYQGFGQGGDRALIAALTRLLPVQPDRTIVLTAAPATAAARVVTRAQALDRYERQDAAFHARVGAGYAAIAAADPDRCRVVAGDAAPDAVHALVCAALGL